VKTFQYVAIAAALVLLGGASQAHACDCLISKNWGKPQCKGRTPVPVKTPADPSNTNSQGQGQSQTQGQGQSQSSTNANTNTSRSNSTVKVSQGPVSAAGGAGGSATGGASSVGNTSAVTGPSTSSATANSANQGNSSATGGTATTGPSTSDSNSGGNSYSSVAEAPRIPVATALAGIGVTTAGCRFAEGLGVQTMPAGTSVGLSFKDHDCARFEIAQFLYSRGQDAAGDRVMCQIKDVSDALGKDCLTIIHAAPAVPADAVTHADLDTALRAHDQVRGVQK
jgi:hypothetical protein